MYARPLFLIATGPSREEHPIAELKEEGHFVMGINRVVREIPLSIFHCQDVSDYAEDVIKHQDNCVALIPGDSPMLKMGPGVTVLRYPRTRIPQAGSGMTGLFLAANMGFDPIFLVGYDYNVNGNGRYQHDLNRWPLFKETFPSTRVFNTSKRCLFARSNSACPCAN